MTLDELRKEIGLVYIHEAIMKIEYAQDMGFDSEILRKLHNDLCDVYWDSLGEDNA